MLTAKGEEIDRVMGLEMGADDYITKPFSMRELLARMRALIRRSVTNNVEIKLNELEFGTVKIIPSRRTLIVDGKELELTRTEFDLIYLLANNPDHTFTREQLLEEITDREYGNYDRSIDMHISHLRNKLKKQKTEHCAIKTVWGTGYKFEVSE
jgi:DNA-binding response OmpR family regulator